MLDYSINNNRSITVRSIFWGAALSALSIDATAATLPSLPRPPEKAQQSDRSLPASGTTRYEKETLDALMHKGRVSLNGTTITGGASVKGTLTAFEAQLKDVTVDGQLKAKGSQMQSVMVNGHAELKKCTIQNLSVLGRLEVKKSQIKGETAVAGHLYTEDSTFEKDIIADSNKIIVAHSTLQNIVIKANGKGSMGTQQTIQLKGKTIVNGSITFERPGGVVRVDDDVIIKGDINGGTLEKRAHLKRNQTA